MTTHRRSSRVPFFHTGYSFQQKDTSLWKGGTMTGFPRDSRGKRAKPWRERTDRCAIDRKISTDYNGKLFASRDAFFFAIDFAHRWGEDREYESNDDARGEKCSGLPKLHAHIVKLVGNLRNAAGGWHPFVRGQCNLFASGFANPSTSLSTQRLIITSLYSTAIYHDNKSWFILAINQLLLSTARVFALENVLFHKKENKVMESIHDTFIELWKLDKVAIYELWEK